ncbi:MAG TPA: STAS domain-containing protein [Terriglobales bacterium]|jgi:anti-anti-sigma regulatory factor
MATIAVWLKIEEDRAVQALQEAGEALHGVGGEVVMDLSGMRRIDASLLQAMEQFAGRADEKATKVALHGVSVDIYKVLRLVKLTSRFFFAD